MKRRHVLLSIFLLCIFPMRSVHADEATDVQSAVSTSQEFVRLAWKFSHDSDYQGLDQIYDQTFTTYEAQAKQQALELNAFPVRDVIGKYQIMNDVATVMFIKAEALMRQGKNDEAKLLFNLASTTYPWSQAWDPSRGSYWSIKEKSQASIRVLNGESQEPEAVIQTKRPKTMPTLAFPGTDKVVNYLKYGKFLNVGTKEYHYEINDQQGLIAAVGEGIYPNIADIYKDPEYKNLLKAGRLEGNHWDFINTEDLQAALYKWITAPESWGVRLFYLGVIYEKAKMYFEAIRAYHALIVHFPNTMAWTYWQTPWYPGQAAIAKIKHIIRMHPDLHMQFKWAKIRILNSYDNDPVNDITITKPGIIKQLSAIDVAKGKLHLEQKKQILGNPVKTIGDGRVQLVKYENRHWQLLVDHKPFLIKGVTYAATKIGQGPDNGTLTNWMTDDFNKNGLIDGPYDSWLDQNHNDIQDVDEPTVGDFALMKEMGVNTLRIYQHPERPIHKELLRKMYDEFGLMVMMGNLIGKYAVGSGASWSEGTDYENPQHLKNMMDNVRTFVTEFKDEPFVLMWLLGNENNYGVASNADKKPEAYYKFVNDVAFMIKSIDPNHPVAICNGDTLFLDKFAQLTPAVDVFAANVYRGDYGFGSFWQQVSEAVDKPAFISEYGAPAHGGLRMNYEQAKEEQAIYHKGNWLDIEENSAGYSDGQGNSIGGVAFEWADEWWKNYEPALHDTKADVVGPFPGGYYFEEWFGLFGQGQGKNSPYLREPRKVYYTYKKLWNR